jgi:2-acylglycerol O-acyltransferase 2
MRFAPLRIPFERRLQTAGILLALVLLPLTFALIVAMLVWAPLVRWYSRELFALYIVWEVLDRKTPFQGGRPFLWLRNLPIWKHATRYFPAELHVPEGGYDPTKRQIFALHPHGVISVAAIANFIWNANDGVRRLGVDYRVATVSFNFLLPFWRELIMGMGFVVASRPSIRWLLDHGKSVMIVIGGAAETLYSNPGSAELVLRRRKGFIELALETGAQLVPVYHHGEVDLYTQAQAPWLRRLQQLAIRVLGFTLPVVRGRGIFQYEMGILPRRVPLHTVMGPAIDVPRRPNPPRELVDEYHAKYIAALEDLYNSTKGQYAHPTDFHGNPIPAQPLKIVA